MIPEPDGARFRILQRKTDHWHPISLLNLHMLMRESPILTDLQAPPHCTGRSRRPQAFALAESGPSWCWPGRGGSQPVIVGVPLEPRLS